MRNAAACNHELRGLNALLNCWVDGLHFPYPYLPSPPTHSASHAPIFFFLLHLIRMLCLVDFLGFRLIARFVLILSSLHRLMTFHSDPLPYLLLVSSILPITNKTLIYGRHVASVVLCVCVCVCVRACVRAANPALSFVRSRHLIQL